MWPTWQEAVAIERRLEIHSGREYCYLQRISSSPVDNKMKRASLEGKVEKETLSIKLVEAGRMTPMTEVKIWRV